MKTRAWVIIYRVVAGLSAVSLLAILALMVYINRTLEGTTAFQDALKLAIASPEISKIIGPGVHQKLPAFGYAATLGQSEFAQWSVPLTGTAGSGHLFGVANQVNGVWEYSRLLFKSDQGQGQVDLTRISPISFPNVPTKSVFLVPFGLDNGETLDWVPAFYKSKLGIDVTVLPSVPLDSNLIERDRDQLDAEKCINNFLKRQYRNLAADPSAVIVAITSKDMFISGFGWRYAENFRSEGRFAVISSSRLHPWSPLGTMNPEWLNSRLQKLLTKNLAILYFDMPLSSDYTSLLSGGVLAGWQIDQMGGQIVGAERRWDPFFSPGGPEITIYDVPGKSLFWNRVGSDSALLNSEAQTFSTSAKVGLMIQRQADFTFEDEPALQFTRVYRNQDDRSRAFGIGGSDCFDMFLGGQMGVAVDLITDDGTRIHFTHKAPAAGQRGDTYLPSREEHRFIEAVFMGDTWQVTTKNGWTYFFPYRPKALPQYVTVLTGFIDPEHHRYEMERDEFGSLLDVTSASGKWLHFANDDQHRIRKITASSGRTMQYEYDGGGHMIRATASDGHVNSYTYDDRGQMLTAAHGDDGPILTNQYFSDGRIKSQTMSDGKSFEYAYFHDGDVMRESFITDPNKLETYIQYDSGGYEEGLPMPHPN